MILPALCLEKYEGKEQNAGIIRANSSKMHLATIAVPKMEYCNTEW